jgi:hypothetical protein
VGGHLRVDTGVSARARPTDAQVALLVAVATLAVCAAANLPMLLTCAARGDTWALMLHSTRFHHASAGEWMRHGFEQYFVNYPEATRPYTSFVRPVVNATIWLESLVAAGPNSVVFFLTNYLGHAACAAMVYLAGVRLGGLTRGRALLAAALFAGTFTAVELLQSPAFRADMLGAAFGTAALLAAHRWLGGRGWAWIAAAVPLLGMAIFSKETAVTAPFIVAGALVVMNGDRSRRARIVAAAAVVAVPLALFAMARAMGPRGGTYVSLAGAPRSAIEVLSSAFFPGAGAFELWAVLRGHAPSPWDAALVMAGFALNATAWLLVARALLRRDERAWRLAAMMLLALAVPLLLAPAPRMLYFGQMFALPLLALVLPRGREADRVSDRAAQSQAPPGSHARPYMVRSWPRITLALATVALIVGPAATLARMAAMQPSITASNRDSHAVQAAIRGVLADRSVHRVYLLNDVTGDYGALAMLQSLALDAGRGDVALRVVNSMGRFGDGAPGRVSVRVAADSAAVTEQCAASCDFSFPGVLPEDLPKLGDRGIAYRRVAPRELEIRIPAAPRDFALVGFDPSAPGVHVLGPQDAAWHPLSSWR